MSTTLKTCFKCEETKPRTEFYTHPRMADGLLGKCKPCTKKDATDRRNTKIDEVREYDTVRAKLPHRREARRMYCHKYRAENPEKYHATMAVGNAIRAGKLTRKPCETCGREDSHAHHSDYSKPLDVRWLCPVCHKREHLS